MDIQFYKKMLILKYINKKVEDLFVLGISITFMLDMLINHG